MKALLSSFSLALLFLAIFSSLTFADVISPGYFEARCNPGEIEVVCSWSRKSLDSPIINNGCARYERNPNYRPLIGTGSTFGGSQKFCFKAVSSIDFVSYHIRAVVPLLLLSLLLEISVFLVWGFRSRKALVSVLSANLISVPLFYLFTTISPFGGFFIVLVMELTVIILEAVFIKSILKGIGFKKILFCSFIANAFSAILGTMLLIFINRLVEI